MSKEQQRHDISDKVWNLLEPHLPGQRGQWGGIAQDNRRFINGVFWILRTGAPCGIYRRAMGNGVLYISVFEDGVTRGSGKNCWKFWLTSLILNGWWLMPVTVRYIHMQQEPKAATRTWAVQKGAQYQDSPCRGCKWYAGPSTYHRGYPSWLQRSRGYDTNQIIAYAAGVGMNIVIPPKRNRKQQREYDRYLYRLRHLVENAFLHLKRWRGIATRYAKNTASFLAAVQIRCIAIWCAILA